MQLLHLISLIQKGMPESRLFSAVEFVQSIFF